MITSPTKDLSVWQDNPIKRSAIGDERLEKSITEIGILQPLIVVKQNERLIVVDGNRRLRIAKRIGLEAVPTCIIESDLEPKALALILNTSGRAWDSQTVGQLIVGNPDLLDLVSPDMRRKLRGLIRVLGEGFGPYITAHGIGAWEVATAVASRAGRHDDDELLRCLVRWLTRRSLTFIVRAALKSGFTVSSIIEAAMADAPLTFGIEEASVL